MLPSNHDALRAALMIQFNALSHGATGAAQISLVLEELSKATKNILADLASEWNYTHNALRRMPAEVLAMCFTPLHLDLRDAMAVSHVSRSWRAIALAHPALWSSVEMTLSCKDEVALLQMQFSRTGQYPVDFNGHCALRKGSVGPLVSCLAQHMSHLRRIQCWGLDLQLHLPAPLLQYLIVRNFDLAIPPDFLGGQAARLTLLHVSTVRFPTTCPALSTLRYLNIESCGPSALHRDRAYGVSFGRIFELCPRLERLFFNKMKIEDADFLPTTPAPDTLRAIDLYTRDPGYDLIRHYFDWKSGRNLQNVMLSMDESTFLECRLQDFASGCTKLAITEWDVKRITVSGPDANSKRTLSSSFDGDYSQIAQLLLRGKSGLSSVETLEVPVDAVEDLISEGVFAQALPKLTHLALEAHNLSGYNCGWDSLALMLICTAAACPRLARVGLHFKKWPLTADDARELLVALKRYTPPLSEININVVHSDSLHDVQVPVLQGCRIEFRELDE